MTERDESRLPAMARLTLGTAGLGAAIGVLTHGVLPRVIGSWGATRAEREMQMPGDDLIASPSSQETMVVSIAAKPAQVWPWIVQMGVDRAGFYSWTWVENGMLRLGVENADEIHPEWQDLKIGDVMAFTPTRYPGGRVGPRVVAIEPNHSLVLDTSPGAPEGVIFATWQFLLLETGGTTRLLLRSTASHRRPWMLRVMDFVLQPGYLLMDRAMLLGIRERAENWAKSHPVEAEKPKPVRKPRAAKSKAPTPPPVSEPPAEATAPI